jgi:penicillin amidase
VFYLDPSSGLAYCKARAYWDTELQTGVSFVHASQAPDLGSFDVAARQNTAGFNFTYADDRGNIAYWHTGRIPIRAPGHDPRLPVPGDGSFDWRGYLDPTRWPSVVNPAQGWLASWNNKPQASWSDSGDGVLWGAFQRARQPMSLLAARPALDLAAAWGVAKRTGELDLRATLGFKPFITDLAKRSDLTPTERAAVLQVAGWDGTAFYPGGAERDSAGQPTGKVASPAFAITDAWFAALERRVAEPLFGGALAGVGPDAETGVRTLTQTPGTISPKYEFFDNYDQFVYDALAGQTSERGYLGGASVSDVSLAALREAVGTLSGSQGADPAHWQAAMPQIMFTALDVSSIPTIPWENRGTWGQAVELGGRLASAGACSAPSLRVGLRSRRGRVVRARVYENGRLVRSVRGRSLRSVMVPRPRGSHPVVVTVVAYTARGGRLLSTRTYRGCTKTRRHGHTVPAPRRRHSHGGGAARAHGSG